MVSSRHKLAKPYKSKIHLDQVWTYRITCYQVTIREENCLATHRIPLNEFSGWSWDDIGRQSRRGRGGLQITPSQVRDWIENKIMRQ